MVCGCDVWCVGFGVVCACGVMCDVCVCVMCGVWLWCVMCVCVVCGCGV